VSLFLMNSDSLTNAF